MTEKSRKPPKFFPNDFKESTTVLLCNRLGLTVEDISHENCRNVYLKLVNIIQTLIDNGITFCSSIEPAEDSDSDIE